jgi:GrpB-like predicted nucleotidyltransferase (UPF0157 family)
MDIEPIILEEYNPIWKSEYRKEKKDWELILDYNLISIHHIGSTAIPGIKSKPIIDILIELDSIEGLAVDEDYILENGYENKGENGIEGRVFYQRSIDGKRKFHVHCYQYDHPQLAIHLKFKKMLLADEALAKEYETLKIKLAKKYKNDRQAYTEGKNEFIKKVIDIL